MNKFLKRLQLKCNLDYKFVNIIISLVDKLYNFGYISNLDKNRLYKKLYNNIDTVIFSDSLKLDYKSGYYDSIKKELYIKDITNIESIYLRLIYILTTKEIGNKNYIVGYSKAYISSDSYRIEHSNYGINRAIVSNLVCRLLYTLPTTLSIVPTYRSFENNFLGYKVNSDNDIYFLEGKLFRQLCFVLGVDDELLYNNLFKSNPNKQLYKIFKKFNIESIIELLDELSKEYSNYNKLCYFNKILTENYLNQKKHCLDGDEILSELIIKEKQIKININYILNKLNPHTDEAEYLESNLDSSLLGKISDLENSILVIINKIQAILTTELLNKKEEFSIVDYVIALKKLQNMLILKNEILDEQLYETISKEIIFSNEYSSTNIIEKIKYSIVNYVISNDKYSKIYLDISFKKILTFEDDCFVLISIGSFAEILHISNLNLEMKDLSDNVQVLQLNNLRNLLNNINSDTDYIETVFSKLKENFSVFKNLSLENVFSSSYNDIKFLYITIDNNIHIVNLQKNFDMNLLELSESYNIIGKNKNMPVIYNEKKSKKLASILSLFV
jgi:hypothetical protein